MYLIVLVAIMVALAIVVVPEWQARRLPIRDLVERSKRADEYRRTLVQFFGALAVVATLFFTSQQIATTREGQVTDRLGRAIQHMGSGDTVQMVGGIYELDRVARESPTDRAAAVQVLAAFVRTHAPVRDTALFEAHSKSLVKPRPEIAAALTVLRRWSWSPGGAGNYRVDLSKTELAQVDLASADLHDADFTGAHISGDLRRVVLDDAAMDAVLLYDFSLDSASLKRIRLRDANLCFGSMRSTALDSASLARSQWSSVNVAGATFRGADGKLADMRDIDIDISALGDGRLGREVSSLMTGPQLRQFAQTREIRLPKRLHDFTSEFGALDTLSPIRSAAIRCR
jgi:uncharacterized protein YjbI with pentapeptide repeats